MSVLEIAKIQVRRGDARVTGIPHLDAGEFGWAIAGTAVNSTTPELYIGNGSLVEGAAVEGVTRILTEYDSSISSLSTTTSYIYQPHLPTILADTYQSTVRTVQDKLSDLVSAWDFADTNTGIAIITGGSIQRAINSLYSGWAKSSGPFNRVGLIIPPGLFIFADPLIVPPYITLIGAGKGKTIFETSSVVGPLLQFSDDSGGILENNSATLTADNRAKYIQIVGITLRHDATLDVAAVMPLIRADFSTESKIVDCEFEGHYKKLNDISTVNVLNCGIEIRGRGGINSQNLIIDNCTFKYLKYGVRSLYDIEDTVISNCRFEHMYQGVVHGSSSLPVSETTGPLRTKLHANKFYNVEREGFYADVSIGPTNHISSYNTFKLVGNGTWWLDNGDYNAITPVITYLSSGNQSIGDYSNRFNTVNNTSTAVVSALAIGGKMYTDLNAVYTAPIITALTTATTLVKFPYSAPETLVNIQYSIFNAGVGVSRKGTMVLNAGTIGTGPTASMSDNFSYVGAALNSDGGVTFSVELSTSTNTINLNYLCTQSGNNITYKFSQLQ